MEVKQYHRHATHMLFAILPLLMVTLTSFAEEHNNALSSCYNENNCRTVLSVAGGVAISSDVGSSQTFPIVNPITDEFFIYTADNSTQVAGAVDAFLGVEWSFHPDWAIQMGLGYNQAWDFEAEGTFLQGADIQSENQYAYQYDILTRQLLVEGKLLYHYKDRYHPYLLLGLGASFNEASGYETNVPGFLTFTREYQDNTQTSFTYNIGIGIDVDIRDDLRLGVGYRFADVGQVELGDASIDTTSVSGTLSQEHLYISEILAQLTILM